MEKESEMLERMALLEKELATLRSEVAQLKTQVKLEQVTSIQIEAAPTVALPKRPVQKEAPIVPKREVREETVPKKEKRSLEDLFTRALPRIFMVILVLGILWGLKLVSDYGFLSDSVKIVAGFALSIGFAVFAFAMEKKKKGSPVVALSLYGGSFIVGILTTAAGAILYDVLSLTIALLLALVYIVYGVMISYLKGNEALTALVVFTSLLLPYLLEYMQFSAIIIGIFVVLLFAVVQVVILKHIQRHALYIGTIFSILAVTIVSTFHNEHDLFFSLAITIVYSIFIVSYLRLYSSKSKRHASFLFSLTIVVLTILNGFLWQKEAILLLFLIAFLALLGGALYIVWTRKDQLLIDMFATLGILTLLNVIAQLNISREIMLLLFIIVSFAGLLLALKHAIVFMKWVKGITFSILAFFVVVINRVDPFFSIEHLTLVLVISMLVGLYYVLYRYKQAAADNKKSFIRLEDIYPCLLYFVALVYIWKLDWTYLPLHLTSYLMISAIAVGFAGIILINRLHTGQFLPFVAAVMYGFSSLVLLTNVWVDDRAVIVAILVRFLYIAIIWAIVADLWNKGKIYRNYEPVAVKYTEHSTIASMIVSIIWFFHVTRYMNYHVFINWNTAVIINTISIFIIACLSLFLAAKRSYRHLKLVGIALLFFGIIKMIFFDLSELDILIRSISFIIIGAIGLVISNKLLGKEKEN